MKADSLSLSVAVLTTLAADAFHQPLPPQPLRLRAHNSNSRTAVRNTIHFSSLNDDVSSDIDALESDLADEIQAALELAQQAIEGSTEEGLDEIANLLLEEPPNLIPTPPEDAPTESIISSGLEVPPEETTEEEEEEKQPLPPTSPPPPPPQSISFGETLQKAAMAEAEKLKQLLFGIKEDISETESRVEEAKGAADTLKQEIEASIKERDETVKTIESEFAAEKERLVEEIGTASEDLQLVIDQSEKNLTDAQADVARADDALMSTMESLASAIQEITSEVIDFKKEKEEIQETKPARLNKVLQETEENMRGVRKSIEIEKTFMSKANVELVKMAEEAESKVKEAYDAAAIIRNERVSLQDQIDTVERSALTQIAELEQQLVEDDVFYAKLLETERVRISKVIDDAYQKYGEIVGKEESKRKSVEADYASQLSQKEEEGKAALDAIETKVKEKLDALESKHSKERIAIYQQKIEAVAEERQVMLAELAVESAKLGTIHSKMNVKLNRVRTDVAGVTAAFEQELRKRQQLAEEERKELLGRIEDVQSDMTSKITAQQEIIETEKSAYINKQDAAIVTSEEEWRQALSELETLKTTLNDTDEEKRRMEDTVADKAALIESYENDRTSFRKSVRLSFKVAREKIGSKAKRVIGKGDK